MEDTERGRGRGRKRVRRCGGVRTEAVTTAAQMAYSCIDEALQADEVSVRSVVTEEKVIIDGMEEDGRRTKTNGTSAEVEQEEEV